MIYGIRDSFSDTHIAITAGVLLSVLLFGKQRGIPKLELRREN
jgi:hypothetical protein